MNRVKAICPILIIPVLVCCSRSLLPRQDTTLSTLILPDTLSSTQSNYARQEENKTEKTTAVSDSFIPNQGSKKFSADSSVMVTQVSTASDSVVNNKKWIIASMLEDQGKLWTSPMRAQKKNLIFWIPVLTATTVTAFYDEAIYSAFKDFQDTHDWVSDISPVITWGGENVFVLSVGGLFYLSGVLSKKDKAKQTGLIALQTWVHAGLIVQVGKLLTGRQRPSFENGKDKWHGFPASLNRFNGEPSSKYDAFPSGHTIEAWALATIIAEQYKNIKIVPILSYSLATGVGLSRITEDAHWLSDVILGAALGYSIGKFMVRERKDTRWTIFPGTSADKMKITAFYRF